MKIAIIANNEDQFVKPTAEGLHRMLNKINIESKIYYDGHEIFMGFRKMNIWSLRYFIKSSYFNLKIILNFLKLFLKGYDLFIIVSNTPRAFLRNFLVNIEFSRKIFKNQPIILYDPHYMPTRGKWYKWITEGKPDAPWLGTNNYGMERYDYYLVVSVVSEFPLAKIDHPISIIGVNLEDGTLYPEKKNKFLALIDFEQVTNMYERAIMIQALEDTKTEYVVLHHHYTIEDIRTIYRKCSIYFLASRESFGFPTIELQACGAYIFTPYSNWVPSHWFKDPYTSGEGHLSPNFIVYDNDINKLKKEIIRIKNNYDPYEVFDTFVEYYPQFYYGNLDELSNFISKVGSREINSNSHLKYFEINSSIVDTI